MSISPSLRASARSAYRGLLRASALTFSGDEIVLQAFRWKIRTETREAQMMSDPKLYEEKVQLAREIATVLRTNIVQGIKIREAESGVGPETWKLRITTDTELGDNKTIKNPGPIVPSRRLRKLEKATQISPGAALHDTSIQNLPRNYSALKKAHKERQLPELKEDDLEETFVRGSGPGGQSVNKTENNVQLKHKLTGIRVTCHETRSLATNRMLARRILLEKLDKVQNPGLSKGELQRAKMRERDRRRRKKAKKKAHGIDDEDNENSS